MSVSCNNIIIREIKLTAWYPSALISLDALLCPAGKYLLTPAIDNDQ